MKPRIDHYRIIGLTWAPPEHFFTCHSYMAVSNSPYWVRLGALIPYWDDADIFHPEHTPGEWDRKYDVKSLQRIPNEI